ncbi:hypothetical protein LCGC14_1346180, partial [marine sediment metagenome]
MRTLDATLQTAQDGAEHQPAISLTSASFADAIPFKGNPLEDKIDSATWRPHMLSHSDGRLCTVLRQPAAGADDMYLYYTDTERTTWTAVDIGDLVPGTYTEVVQAAIVEFTTGNLGIVFIATRGGVGHGVYKAIISRTGVIVQQEVQLATFAIGNTPTGIHVERYDNGRYYVVYSYEDATTPDQNLYKLTTKDWTTWAGPTAIVPSGLTNPIRNPATFQTDEGDVFMVFDYIDVEIGDDTESNIYSMMSVNEGDTWDVPSARTAFTTLGTSAMDPIIVQRSDGTLYLIFYESSSVLNMDETTTGWLDSTAGGCPLGWSTKHITFIPATNEVYIVYGWNTELAGFRVICGVLVVDVATWSITDVYRDVSTPAINNHFMVDAHMNDSYGIDSRGRKIAWADSKNSSDGNVFACVLDVEHDTLTYYTIGTEDWDGDETYSLPRTVTIDWEDTGITFSGRVAGFKSMCFNDDGTELWFMWQRDLYNAGVYVGYINLDDSPDGDGMYPFTWVLTNELGNAGRDVGVDWARFSVFTIDCIRVWDGAGTGSGYIALSGFETNPSFNGGLLIYTKAGVALYSWEGLTHAAMPINGCASPPVFYEGEVFFGIYWKSGVHVNQRGLCRVNLASEAFTFHRPTYATEDQYHLYYAALDSTNGVIYFAPRDGRGVASYNIGADSWTLYNDENVPGIGFDTYWAPTPGITVDPATGNVFVGWGYVSGEADRTGLTMFNITGDFTQVKYLNGLKNGSWAWDAHGARVLLVAGTASSYPAPAVDSDNVLWLMWDQQNLVTTNYTLTWDRDWGAFDLAPDLMGKVRIKWEMKRPNTLSFSLARGHLYDPQNTMSTYRDLCKKGRRIVVQLGEIVSGTVQRFERGHVYIDLGRAIGVMFQNESIPGEHYQSGQRMRFYVLAVQQEERRRPGIVLSRAHPDFILKLFELEVPEISEGTVEIKKIAREPGSRTKIAVISHQDGIDPVGSVVGQRGSRIMAVINELGNEKIDVIEWSEDTEEYIGNSLSPAKVKSVEAQARREATVLVAEDQLSLAIGRGGQNVRLAAKLTGWKI